MMVVLHFANITSDKCSGVCVAVPNQIISEQTRETVALVNLSDTKVENVNNLFYYGDNFSVSKLSAPFDEPDIAVFHGVYFFQFTKIAKELRRREIPYIIVPHGSLSKTAQNKKKIKKSVANILLFNKFINSVKAVRYLSRKEKDETVFFTSRSFISPNGMSLPNVKKSTFSSDGLKITYIGRYETRIKGIDLLLSAIHNTGELLRKGKVTVCLYGSDSEGEYKKIKKIITKLGIEDIVSLNHEVLGNDKEKVLLDTDVFIHTSRSEGMPLGVLEALSYGVPCIVTEGTCLSDIVSKYNAGFACKTNVESISAAIERAILEKGSLYKMSENAVSLIENSFSSDSTTEKTIEMYKKFSE